jgi:hypothetical protein
LTPDVTSLLDFRGKFAKNDIWNTKPWLSRVHHSLIGSDFEEYDDIRLRLVCEPFRLGGHLAAAW